MGGPTWNSDINHMSLMYCFKGDGSRTAMSLWTGLAWLVVKVSVRAMPASTITAFHCAW